MKATLTLILFAVLAACSSDTAEPDFNYTTSGSGACTYNGHSLHVGEEGGCYYYNSNGNKTYVDRENCADCN